MVVKLNLSPKNRIVALATTAALAVGGVGLAVGSTFSSTNTRLSVASFPTPSSTGVPAGTALTPYTGSLSPGCGTVIDSKTVNGDLTISAGNGTHSASTPCVTIKNSKINGIINDYWTSRNAGPVLVLDSEVANPTARDVAGASDSNLFMWRSYVHGARSGIQCDGFCEIHDSYLLADVEYGAAHMDAFITNGNYGNPLVLDHNSFLCAPTGGVPNGAGCAADVGTFPDFGVVSNMTMTNNIFRATNDAYYCFHTPYEPSKPYGTQGRNNVITGNVFEKGSSGKCGGANPIYDWNNVSGKWCNNLFDDGTQVLPGNPDNCGSIPPTTVTTTTVKAPTTLGTIVSTVPPPTSTTKPSATTSTTKPTTSTTKHTFTCTQVIDNITHKVTFTHCT